LTSRLRLCRESKNSCLNLRPGEAGEEAEAEQVEVVRGLLDDPGDVMLPEPLATRNRQRRFRDVIGLKREDTRSGRRIYGSTDLRTLAFIRRSRELGFSLDEIRALLRLGGPEKVSCREVREITAHHLQDIRAKLDDLKKLERLLSKTVARGRARHW
jgi:DNA-binding transcriptional MerR regulator